MTREDAKARAPPGGTLAGGAPPAAAAALPPAPTAAGRAAPGGGWISVSGQALKIALCKVVPGGSGGGAPAAGAPSAGSAGDTAAGAVGGGDADADAGDGAGPSGGGGGGGGGGASAAAVAPARAPVVVVEAKPAGLLNVGDTCYLNAVVQVLFHTPEFRRALLRFRPLPAETNADDIAAALQRVFAALDAPAGYFHVDPSELVDILRDKARLLEFDADGQQDAHEFLRFLLENVSSSFASTAATHRDTFGDCGDASGTSGGEQIDDDDDGNSGCHRRRRHLSDPLAGGEDTTGTDTPPQATPKRPANGGLDSPPPSKRPKVVPGPSFPFVEEETLDGSSGASPGRPLSAPHGARPASRPATPAASASPSSPEERGGGTRPPVRVAKKVRQRTRARWDEEAVRTIFGGETVTSTRCSECETASLRPEAFLDLSVPVELGRSLSGSFTAMSAGDLLVGRDKYACDVCHTKTEAERRLYLSKLPRVMTIHLKLFQYTAAQAGAKIPVATPCPLRMRFSRWCTQDCAEQAPGYLLTAVIVHAGGCSTSGHYYAYILHREHRRWYLFDDSVVSEVAEEDIKRVLFSSARSKKTGYLLFYSAVDDD